MDDGDHMRCSPFFVHHRGWTIDHFIPYGIDHHDIDHSNSCDVQQMPMLVVSLFGIIQPAQLTLNE
jgi:hypothetical protein